MRSLQSRPKSAMLEKSRPGALCAGAALSFCLLLAGWVVGCTPPSGAGTAKLELDAEQMKIETAEMLKISDTLERHRRMIELIDAIDEDNLAGALDGYEENLTKVDPHEVRLIANKWAQIDPHGAVVRILDQWTYSKIANQAVLEAVYIWVNSDDSKAARAYVDPNFDGPIEARRSPSKFMVRAVLQALGVAGKHDELTSMFAELENDGDRELYLTQTMIEINRARGMGEVKAWVDSIPWDTPKDLKFSALKRGLDWIAKVSGPHAAEWWEEYEDHPSAIRVLPMAVKAWGVLDPGPALLWLGKRQPTTVQAALAREIARGWLTREPEEAEAWIVAHLDEPVVLENATLVLANRLVKQMRFEEAIELATKAPDPKQRDVALVAVLREWSAIPDGAVEQYVAAGHVPDEVVAAWRKKMETHPIKVRRVRAQKQEGEG